MLAEVDIDLASLADVPRIAALSRDQIEQGLGWRWTPPRVAGMIREPSVNGIVARVRGDFAGFAIMRYRDDEAHLILLAVEPAHRRKKIGTAMLGWLEASALVAGVGCVYLEARAGNREARAFYRQQGYREIDRLSRLYSPHEDGVRIARDLWANPAT